MKKLLSIAMMLMLTVSISKIYAQKAPASPREKAEGKINDATVTVDYGSPAVKGREIWGGLEKYDVVWRAGANGTTAVTFMEDVMIAGELIEAGTYGLYIIPREDEDWTVIFNTDWDREQHGAWGAYSYKEENDVVRIDISPEFADDNQERLIYAVEDGGIAFAWEKARLMIPIESSK